MIQSTPFARRVQQAFTPTPRGVVGLVDDLLSLCRTHQLRIVFRDGRCEIRRLGAGSKDALDLSVPQSVFRAVLARVAVLCNDHRPHSATPYRGEGEVAVPRRPDRGPAAGSTCYAAFTNTPSDQRLELRFSRDSAGGEAEFTVVFRDKRTATVFGHTTQYVAANGGAGDGVYEILARTGGKSAVVGVFSASEVIAVFRGDLHESHPGDEQAEPSVAPDPPKAAGG